MAGPSLTKDATLQCPHGGSVQITTANMKSKAGAYLALSTDQFIISGCPYQIPSSPPVPEPCVSVKWSVSDTKVKVNNTATLSQSCVGICQTAAQVPKGPVVIMKTQMKVQTK